MQPNDHNNQSEAMLDYEQVASMLSVSVNTVRDYVQQGMPCRRLGYKTVRFFRGEVLKWLDQRHQQQSAATGKQQKG
jgi:predicted DNA-binding transcriptional regulator AlpA